MDSTASQRTAGLLAILAAGAFLAFFAWRGASSVPSAESAPQTTQEKLENAMSAGTPVLARDAAILDWPATATGDFLTLREGTNDWTCLPDYPGSPGMDPMCMDANGMEWFQAYMGHEEPDLTQPAIVYMLRGGSDASNTDPYAMEPTAGDDWITTPSHLMLLPADDLNPGVYGTDPTKGSPWIMWSGTPYMHLMIPVEGPSENVMMSSSEATASSMEQAASSSVPMSSEASSQVSSAEEEEEEEVSSMAEGASSEAEEP